MKNNILELNKQILIIKDELNNEKNKNLELNNKMIELEKKLLKSKENNIIQNVKCTNKDTDNNKNNPKLMELYELLLVKEREIKELRELKLRYPVTLSEGEKLISVIFNSVDQKIHTSIICKNTDKFSKIENLLYDEYPEYKNNLNTFVVNGKIINKYETLDNNTIKNSDVIVLNQLNIKK